MISPYNIEITDTTTEQYIYDIIKAQSPTADFSMDIGECSVVASVDNDAPIYFSTSMNDLNDENQFGVLNAGDGISGDVDIYNTVIIADSITPQKVLVLVEWK